ncbi:hypothetical protein [Plantactinospora sp. WMMB782]|uniref:hypothetical protein n=1 Tax=Plantactinospora sp. WMMB782 TaxID=3404121 RepID=UPI003B92B465
MAEVYRYVNGKKIEGYIADLEGVQLYLAGEAFEIKARADANLQEARDMGRVDPTRGLNPDERGAVIDWGQERDREYGHLDWYVSLDDRGSDLGAMSIEFGRADYIVDEYGRTSGGHEGLYILTRAADLPIERKRRVKIRKVKVRSNRAAKRKDRRMPGG